MYWDGIALRYNETYNVYIEKIEGYDDLVNLDLGSADVHGLKFNNVFKLSYNGYASDLTSDAFYNPSIVYYYATSSTKNANNHVLNQKYITTEITLDDFNNKTKEYEHIIQYDGTSSWRLSNIDFKNTFWQHTSNANTAQTLYNKINSLGASNMIVASCYIAAYDPSPTVSGTTLKRSEGEMSNAQYVNDTSKLSSIGMLNVDKKANEIYQLDKDNKTFNVKKDTFNVDNVTLQSGFQLCAAPENSTVEWEADFSEVYCYNGSSYVTNMNEVDIYLSYLPFSNLTTSTDYIKWKSGGTTQNYITTTNRKATLKWKQDKKSLVYVKCVPHFTGTSYINQNWRINLDLTGKSKSFIVTSAD